MVAPGAAPVIAATNQAGTSRAANFVGGTTMTLRSLGTYDVTYRIDNTHATEKIEFVATTTIDGNSVVFSNSTNIDDTETLVDAIYAALITGSTELAGVPAAGASLQDKIEWLFMAAKNQNVADSGAGTTTVTNDAGATIGTATVTDVAGVTTKGEFA